MSPKKPIPKMLWSDIEELLENNTMTKGMCGFELSKMLYLKLWDKISMQELSAIEPMVQERISDKLNYET